MEMEELENFIASRLTQLRMQKGVSARDMSLTLGQSASYIHKVESGKIYPSMEVFNYICDYLHISPKDFFNYDNEYPEKVNIIVEKLKTLNEKQLTSIITLLDAFKSN